MRNSYKQLYISSHSTTYFLNFHTFALMEFASHHLYLVSSRQMSFLHADMLQAVSLNNKLAVSVSIYSLVNIYGN